MPAQRRFPRGIVEQALRPGTGPIFDVDNMLRLEEYSPNVWPTTVARDVPRIRDHIEAAWDNRDSAVTYMRILRREA